MRLRDLGRGAPWPAGRYRSAVPPDAPGEAGSVAEGSGEAPGVPFGGALVDGPGDEVSGDGPGEPVAGAPKDGLAAGDSDAVPCGTGAVVVTVTGGDIGGAERVTVSVTVGRDRGGAVTVTVTGALVPAPGAGVTVRVTVGSAASDGPDAGKGGAGRSLVVGEPPHSPSARAWKTVRSAALAMRSPCRQAP